MLGLFLPVFFVISFILVSTQDNVFFKQERAGKNGTPFTIFKFKSMSDETHLSDKERLTWLGAFLRSTSLDELPQLLNVIKGQMSIVGPRPLYLIYNKRYNSKHITRLSVLPGITGWAQVSGGNNLSWEEKFDYDVWYVKHLSFLLDVKIVFKTFVYSVANITMTSNNHLMAEEFIGYRKEK